MNIVKTGSTYKTFPVGTYVIQFSKLQGFFVESRPDFNINEKVYGTCESKPNKVLRSFGLFERSL